MKKFEDMLEKYLDESEETLTHLETRAAKKAGKKKAKVNREVR